MTRLQFHPATQERWPDLEDLFGKNGANAGCWCMFWRLERAMFKKTKGDGNRQLLKQIVEAGEQPGILAYDGKQAVTCFYTMKEAPRQGIDEVGQASETQLIMRLKVKAAPGKKSK